MPNWCSNNLKITCKDSAKIQTLVDAWTSGRFMQTLYPCPQDLRDTIAGSYSDDEKQKEFSQRTIFESTQNHHLHIHPYKTQNY